MEYGLHPYWVEYGLHLSMGSTWAHTQVEYGLHLGLWSMGSTWASICPGLGPNRSEQVVLDWVRTGRAHTLAEQGTRVRNRRAALPAGPNTAPWHRWTRGPAPLEPQSRSEPHGCAHGRPDSAGWSRPGNPDRGIGLHLIGPAALGSGSGLRKESDADLSRMERVEGGGYGEPKRDGAGTTREW